MHFISIHNSLADVGCILVSRYLQALCRDCNIPVVFGVIHSAPHWCWTTCLEQRIYLLPGSLLRAFLFGRFMNLSIGGKMSASEIVSSWCVALFKADQSGEISGVLELRGRILTMRMPLSQADREMLAHCCLVLRVQVFEKRHGAVGVVAVLTVNPKDQWRQKLAVTNCVILGELLQIHLNAHSDTYEAGSSIARSIQSITCCLGWMAADSRAETHHYQREMEAREGQERDGGINKRAARV